MKLTHRQVEVFRAVMRSGHVTRAAQWLNSSQPTLSRELARLEQVLGYALFERVRGRLLPTTRAKALMDEVEASFIGLDRIAAAAQALQGQVQGRLQLAALPALTQALLPEALQRLLAEQPQAAVSITPLESPALESALTEQRFDLGLTEQRQAPPACTLHTLLVSDEVAVLPRGHPLARQAVLHAAHFEGQAFISLASADPYRRLIDAMFDRSGVQRRQVVESPSAVSVCALVRQGLGVAIINPLTALALVDTGLELRPLAESIPFHVAAVLPEGRSRHPLRDALLLSLQQAAAALAARLQAAR